MRMLAPAGRGLPGGHAVGQPAGGRRRAGDAGAARRGAYVRSVGEHRAPRGGPARGRRARRRAGRSQVQSAPGLLTVFFSERPVESFAGRQGVRPRRVRGLVPRAARARRVPAAVAVRGLVPVARARADEQLERTLRRGGGGVRGRREAGARAVRPPSRPARRAPSAGAALARAPARAAARGGGLIATLAGGAHAGDAAVGRSRRRPSGGEAAGAALAAARAAGRHGRREEYELLRRGGLRGLPAALRRPRLVDAPDADLGLLAGDRLYAIGLARLVELGDTARGRRAGRHDHAQRARAGRRRRELAEAVWAAGARGGGLGPERASTGRAKELVARRRSRRHFEAMRTSCESARSAPERRADSAPRYC